MLRRSKLLFIVCLLFCIFLSMSFVSASDNITSSDDSYNADKTHCVNNDGLSTDNLDDSSNIDSINKSKSFTDLKNEIYDLNKSEIILEDDYIYQEEYDRNFTEGIFINHSVTIDGQGHVIDAQSKSRIFNIKSDDVVIKNIILMNAHFYKYLDGDEITISTDVEFFEVNTMGHFNGYNGVSYGLGKFKDKDYTSIAYVGETYDGYAIYGSGNNLKIINSSFINNHAHFGGAIYIDGNNSMLVNLTFNNNSACIGGAIHNRGINTKLINLTFNNNSALVGGAISNMGKSIVDTCQFYLNDAKYRGNIIYSGGQGNISIQNCGLGNECGESISFQCEEWQINNITSTYFNSLVKLDIIDFQYDLTHLHEEYYNLKITFGLQPYWYPNAEFCEDYFEYSVNKKFCLNIDGKVYNLQTNEKSHAEIDLKLSNGSHFIEIYNPLTKENIIKSFNVSDLTYNIQPTNKSKSFADLNKLINGDLNKSEIILEDDYIYQEEYDRNFTEGIFINRSVTIDGQGHTIYFDKTENVFHVNAYDVTLKNMVVYNTYMFDIVDLSNGSCITSNLTVIPAYTFLSLTVIANDIYDVYNHSDVINIEFETSIANAYFWVEIPGLLEKTNLTSNNEGKGTLSISNITKPGCYLILSDFIEEKYTEGYYIFSPTIEIVGVPSALKGYKKTIRILYRENPKANNSFSDLQLLIDNSITNEINLEKDYEFFSGDKPINIDKSIVINGNNHSIDAKNVSKIFNIYADNVTLKNIIFTGASDNIFYNKYTFLEPVVLDGMLSSYNAVSYGSQSFNDITYYMYYGYGSGAIYCSGNNLIIINSSFINNYGSTGGGLYIVGNNAQLINLLFINNSAQSGGAIYNIGTNTFISNSRFDSNDGRYADSICSEGNINIQNCKFTNDMCSVIFYGDCWQIDNMTSSYYNSFMKLGHVDFSLNITHLVNDEYNLKINFYFDCYWWSSLENKKFCLNSDGVVYNSQTDSNSQASLYLKLSNGVHDIEVYNPITKLSHSKVFNVSDSNDLNKSSNTNSSTSNGTGSNSGIVNSTGSNTEINTNSSEPSQDVGNGTDVIEPSHDIGNNTNVTEPNQNMKNNANKNQNTVSTTHKTTIVKSSPKVIAKNKNFNKKTKIKKYTLTLKNKSKSIKNVWVSLKINGKTFKAKTNNKGQATFKITKLTKKGEFTAKVIFKGDKYYNSVNKNVKIGYCQKFHCFYIFSYFSTDRNLRFF